MTKKEVLERVTLGDFNNGHGFDMQLLVNTVGALGEMFRNGQISEVVRDVKVTENKCGSCGAEIDKWDKYCRVCGKAVKWNGTNRKTLV